MDLLRTRSLPFMTRRNYCFEMLHMLPWGVVATVIETNVATLIAAKTFNGSHLMISVAAASPYFANMLSLVWGMLCVGRRKLVVVRNFCIGVTAVMLAMAFIPYGDQYGWLYVGMMAGAQMLMSGVITVRTALWKMNYPPSVRAAITARLQTMRFIAGAGPTLLAAVIFDYDPSLYRIVFPFVAFCGVIALYFQSRMHVRHEAAQLRQSRQPETTGDNGQLDEGLVEPFSLVALLSPQKQIGEITRIFREDRRFARYCLALMMTGCGNLMLASVWVIAVEEHLEMSYFGGVILLSTLDRLVTVGMLPRFGKYFDRVGVVRFRVVNGMWWCACMALGLGAAFLLAEVVPQRPYVYVLALVLFLMSRIANGAASAGAALAWHLGHLHFAKPDDAEIYMGVHVFLAGIRGLIMPFLGIILLNQIGWGVWVVSLALGIGGLITYEEMARTEKQAAVVEVA